MRMRRAAVIAACEARILRRDLTPLVVLTAMPLVLMALFRPVFAGGAAQSVPGMTVLFAFFLVGTVGQALLRDQAWGTWTRLRASPATAWEVLLGKVLVPLGMFGLQFAILFSVGTRLLDVRVTGSTGALVVVGATLACCLVSLGLALVAFCRSAVQFQALTNLGALVLAGAAGALVPMDLLPGWLQAVAPATPGYWAMEGFTRVISDGASLREVIGPASALAGFTAVFAALAGLRFRMDEVKATWA